jgi:hypothetical protein
MCIEAALCAALDLPHGDDPECVAPSVRLYKIALNDSTWSSPQARAAGLRNLGLAQLGSSHGIVSNDQFVSRLQELTVRVLIPTLFREVFAGDNTCIDAAGACEREGTLVTAAQAAQAAAWAAQVTQDAWTAQAAAWAAWAAQDAQAAQDAWAAWAAQDAWAAWAAQDAWAAWAAQAAQDAWTAQGTWTAQAAAWAAQAAAWAAQAARAGWVAGAAEPDKYLKLSAGLALQVLTELKSPGVALLSIEGSSS